MHTPAHHYCIFTWIPANRVIILSNVPLDSTPDGIQTTSLCTSQQKLDTDGCKIWTRQKVPSTDAILDRTLRNDHQTVPTAKNSSAIQSYVRRRNLRSYRFSRTCQGQAACGGGCVGTHRGNASGSESISNDRPAQSVPDIVWASDSSRNKPGAAH